MNIVTVYDAIGANVSRLPRNSQVAGYDTGSGDVPWTAAQFALFRNPIHIDQWPILSADKTTADMADFESGAMTLADVVKWIPDARAAFNAKKRATQRWPGVYCSKSNVTPLCNSLKAANLTDVPLWVADYSISAGDAEAAVKSGSGPWPIVGYQFQNTMAYDISVFSSDWLNRMAGTPAVQTTADTPYTNIPLTPVGLYTDGAGDLFLVGIRSDKTLCETKRLSSGHWSNPYPIAGKVL